jgi:hypothetical protein
MKSIFAIVALLLTLVTAGLAQQSAKPQPSPGGDITGLYSFLHEGEFVEIEVNEGEVTGLVSHFKDEDQDKAEFVDQCFEQARLEGSTLSFRTKPADGVWYEFSGTVGRGPAKAPGEEAYWTLKGTLTEQHSSADGKAAGKVHELTLKSFPEDRAPELTPATETQRKEKKQNP